MKAWFLSDIHLNKLDERNGQVLLRFFRAIEKGEIQATHIFLLGDIFDLWVGNHSYFIEKYKELIELIKKLKDQGVIFFYFEGNHDFHLKEYWEKKVGINVYTEEGCFDLGPYKIRAEHGDLMNPEDKSYLRWRAFIRLPAIKKMIFSLPGSWVSFMGEKLSQASSNRRKDNPPLETQKAKQIIRTYAQGLYSKAPLEKKFDYLFTGHIHVQDDFYFMDNDKKIYSINLGFWSETPRVYCLTKEGGVFYEILSLLN